MLDGTPSHTARGVSALRLTFDRVERGYGRPEDDLALQSDVVDGLPEPDRTSRLAAYLQVRTAFFDGAVVDAIESGVGQVVAVGAGYDGRSLRYEHGGVRWFEVDHPATQGDKLERIRRLGIDPDGIAFVPLDLATGDVAEALTGAGYEAGRAALFTCEGVAAYLSRAVVSATLERLASVGCPGSRLAIEIPVQASSEVEQRAHDALASRVAALGEPLTPALPRRELAGFLHDTGWEVQPGNGGPGDVLAGRGPALVVATVP